MKKQWNNIISNKKLLCCCRVFRVIYEWFFNWFRFNISLHNHVKRLRNEFAKLVKVGCTAYTHLTLQIYRLLFTFWFYSFSNIFLFFECCSSVTTNIRIFSSWLNVQFHSLIYCKQCEQHRKSLFKLEIGAHCCLASILQYLSFFGESMSEFFVNWTPEKAYLSFGSWLAQLIAGGFFFGEWALLTIDGNNETKSRNNRKSPTLSNNRISAVLILFARWRNNILNTWKGWLCNRDRLQIFLLFWQIMIDRFMP